MNKIIAKVCEEEGWFLVLPWPTQCLLIIAVIIVIIAFFIWVD